MGKLEMIVSFSAGISFLPDDGTDINTLVEKDRQGSDTSKVGRQRNY